MQLTDFLNTVVTGESGWFCLATRQSNTWAERFLEWPKQLPEIVAWSQELRESGDVYFSPHLFGEKRSLKSAVLPTRTLQADLDHADVVTLPVIPTVLVQTSVQRHQGFWIIDKPLSIDELEDYTRRIAYATPHCDKTGWPAGKKLRMPGTYNYKYDDKPLVEVKGISLKELKADIFNLFPAVAVSREQAMEHVEWVENEPPELGEQLVDLLSEIKPSLPRRVFTSYTRPAKDRSAALWAFETSCFRAGLGREQVYWLAKYNANNKFADRPNGDVELRKDIIRAETSVASQELDVKVMILQARLAEGKTLIEKQHAVAGIVLNGLKQNGEFVHTRSGTLAYLNKNTGRPVLLSRHSDWLETLLNTEYGLNATDQYTKFTVSEILAYTRSLPVGLDLQSLAYYDRISNRLLLHTGGKDVLHIGPDSIVQQVNGYGGIVFMWSHSMEPFNVGAPLPEAATEPWRWCEYVFKDTLNNLTGLETDEGLAILRAWFLFLLFKNIASTRPIFTLLGPPGSGKTTNAKKIYRLVYGVYKSISKIRKEDDFDLATAMYPLVAYDNIDVWVEWLANALAVSTTNTDVEKRILYTDVDTMRLKRQAMLLLTAFNPRFTREDVIDRMVMMMFTRLEHFADETLLLERISDARSSIWASIAADVQQVLRTAQPSTDEAPQFRIQDFSRLGLWFARAAGEQQELVFRSAMSKLQGSQRGLSLDQDHLLVNVLRKYAAQNLDDYIRIDGMYNQLLLYADNNQRAFQQTYKSAQVLGRKLVVMQDSLRSILDIDWIYDDNRISKLWRIREKQEGV